MHCATSDDPVPAVVMDPGHFLHDDLPEASCQ